MLTSKCSIFGSDCFSRMYHLYGRLKTTLVFMARRMNVHMYKSFICNEQKRDCTMTQEHNSSWKKKLFLLQYCWFQNNFTILFVIGDQPYLELVFEKSGFQSWWNCATKQKIEDRNRHSFLKDKTLVFSWRWIIPLTLCYNL